MRSTATADNMNQLESIVIDLEQHLGLPREKPMPYNEARGGANLVRRLGTIRDRITTGPAVFGFGAPVEEGAAAAPAPKAPRKKASSTKARAARTQARAKKPAATTSTKSLERKRISDRTR